MSRPVLRIYHSAVVTAWRARDRRLRAHGWAVTTVSPRRWEEGGRQVAFEPSGDAFVEAVGTLGRHPFRFVYAPWSLWRLLCREPWAVLDVHEEPASLAVCEVLVVRRLLRLGTPVVLYSAENLSKRYPPPFRWFERWALRSAAAVYCCNEAAGQNLREKGFDGHLEVLGLGVDVTRFAAGTWRTDAKHLGYVGRLDERKGVHVAINALAGLPQRVTLSIVGSGPIERELRSLVSELRLDARVRFLSYVEHDDLPDLYRSFDLVLVPSLPTERWEEQFCRVAVEAMATGVPVVASRSGALPEVVGDGGVLVPAGDVAAWTAAIRSLLDAGDERRRLAERASQRSSRYSWEAVTEGHAALYEAVSS